MGREFPGGPVVGLQCFHCCDQGFNSWLGNWDPTSLVVWPKKKKMKKKWAEVMNTHLTKQDIQMANKYIKRCLVLLAIHFSSLQFSRSVVSDSLRPHESQHTRPPCPSPTPGVVSNSRPLSQWRHPTISSSVVPFSSCPQSLPASESFPMSQLFAWGGQSSH